jgi:hypothetical protein
MAVAAMLLLFAHIGAAAQFTDPAHGYRFTYPNDWRCDASPIALGSTGPVLQNLPSERYVANGRPPEGGANIAIHSGVADPPQDIRNRLGHLIDVQDLKYSTPFADSLRADWLDHPVYRSLHNVLLGVTKDGRGVVLFLEYNADDPRGAVFEEVLNGIANSFTWEPTPGSTGAPQNGGSK